MNAYTYLRRLKLSKQLLLTGIVLPILLVIVVTYLLVSAVSGWKVLSFLVLLLTLYTAFTIRFIKQFTTRLRAVKEGLEYLSLGVHQPPLIVTGQDEIARLAASVNQLTGALTRSARFAEQLSTATLESFDQTFSQHDLMGESLLKLKENVVSKHVEDQRQTWVTQGLAKFVEIVHSNKTTKDLANEVVKSLVHLLNANQGALFVISDEKSEAAFLDMQACYAYQRTKRLTQRIAVGEGIIGQAFLEQETVYLKEVPEDFIRITSGLGGANPRNILIIPLRINEEVIGLLELASFQEFEKYQIAFVEKIGENIAHAITSFRVSARTEQLLQAAQAQAERMKTQEEELRQNQEELLATQEEISRKYQVLFKQLGELNYQSKFEQLKSINFTKKRNVEYYFDIIRNQIRTFSENTMIVEAIKEFKSAFHSIGQGKTAANLPAIRERVRLYYEEEFIPRLNDQAEQAATVQSYLPETMESMLLQYAYIANNAHPTGEKSLLKDALDGSAYSQVHARYHPIIRSFLEKFGYYDIFLIDPQTGDVLYSVFKEVDFATSLLTGPYQSTNFARVVKEVMASDDPQFVKLVDFEPYDPSYRAPASFIACPIYEKGQKTGILVLQMPIHKINQILTGDNHWKEDGLGESGETLIVAQDYTLRSISRELIENEPAYLTALEQHGYPAHILNRIRKNKTSILLEEMRLESVEKALNGLSGTSMEQNSWGEQKLSAYTPLAIADVHWMILSTMKESEASMRINDLRNQHA